MNNLQQLAVKKGLTNIELVLLIEPERKGKPKQLISNRAQNMFKMDLTKKPIVFLDKLLESLGLKKYDELTDKLEPWTNNLKTIRELRGVSQHDVGKEVLSHIYKEDSGNTSVIYSGHIERLENMDVKLMDKIIKQKFCKFYSVKTNEL